MHPHCPPSCIQRQRNRSQMNRSLLIPCRRPLPKPDSLITLSLFLPLNSLYFISVTLLSYLETVQASRCLPCTVFLKSFELSQFNLRILFSPLFDFSLLPSQNFSSCLSLLKMVVVCKQDGSHVFYLFFILFV